MTWLRVWHGILDLAWLSVLFFLWGYFWRERQVFIKAHSWLKTSGYVTECNRMEIGHIVWPQIKYSYEVHGHTLTGDVIFLNMNYTNPNSNHSRHVAYEAAVAFEKGMSINIYYNPNNPKQSALDISMPIKLTVLLNLMGLMIIGHIGFMLWRYLG